MPENTNDNTTKIERPKFVHLHNHSEMSLLDGISKPKELAARAVELGSPAIALTDHGRMSGIIEFYTECRNAGVKPIIGIEAYMTPMGHHRSERVAYDVKEMRGRPGHERNNYHLILLAKNYEGYKNLCALSTASFAEGYYYKPRIDFELLCEHREGLIVSSACILGLVSHYLYCDDYKRAREVALRFQDVFGEDYYLEIMNHELDMEKKIMQPIRELGRELGIKVVATNDTHFVRKEDHKLQKTMMLLGMHKSWSDKGIAGNFFEDSNVSDKQGSVEGDDSDSDPIFEMPPHLYLKDYDEMLEVLRYGGGGNGVAEEELAVTLEIANKCDCELPIIDPSDMTAYHTPIYPVKLDSQYPAFEEAGFEFRGNTVKEILGELRDDGREFDTLEEALSEHEMESLRFLMWTCERGLEKRVRPKIEAKGEPLPMEYWCVNPPEGFEVEHLHNSPDELWLKERFAEGLDVEGVMDLYRNRLDYEIGVVVRKGFIDYFSVVSSYTRFTKEQGSPVGAGRGSGAGSLLNYLLDITSIDPLPNGLLFERFLNPARKGYPDIDIDFAKDFRDNKLKPYLREVYGEDSTASVSTYMYLWGKAALRAAARVLFNPPDSVDIANELCDLIDDKPKLDLNDELATHEDGSPVNPGFVEKANSTLKHRQVLELALQLQGRVSGESIHASAYIVSPFPILDQMPLSVTKEERELAQTSGEPIREYLIQYDGTITQDKLGFVKLDLLCLKDLELLELALKTVEKRYGCKIDPESLPLDDKEVFDLVLSGYNSGVFQFDGSPTALRLIQESGANSIGDWSTVNALNRPGPLQMGYDQQFINGKLHPDQIEYFTPAAEKYLKETYGCCCVAEGTMVPTRCGTKPIEDIVVGDQVINEHGEWEKVTATYDNGMKDCVRIHTDYAEDIIVTPDHKVLTSEGWKEAGKLEPGELIKSFNKYEIYGTKREIEPFDWKDWFIGLFIADGHSPDNGTPAIACCNEEFANKLVEIGHKIFPTMENIHVSVTHGQKYGAGTTWYVHFSERQGNNGSFNKKYRPNSCSALLKEYGLFGKTGKNKPWISLDKLSFSTLIGMFEGDGCYQNKRLHVKHEHIARGFYEAATLYGLHASIYQDTERSWTVSVDDLELFAPKIRKYDGQSFEKTRKGGFIPRKYLVKYKAEKLNERQRIILKGTGLRNPVGVTFATANRHFGYTCDASVGEHDCWARVLRVLPLKEKQHVYDITVENTHSFVAHNKVIHNCLQEQMMLMSQDKEIVGFDGGQADHLRKCTAKKKKDELAKIEVEMREIASSNGVSDDVVSTFWEICKAAGSYSFNKCLSGDTLLFRAVRNSMDKEFPCHEVTIEEVYRRWNSEEERDRSVRSEYRSEDPRRGLFVICRDNDGLARKHKVIGVYQQGIRPVFEVELANGKTIKATDNHRFQVADETYKTVDELIINNDELWCCDFEKGYETYTSKVVSITELPPEMTYDVEIDSDEHNFFANGICSHNSHSLAYAVVAYRGAFIKAHFPDCFLAAICTLKPQMKKTNKVPMYLEEARQLGITVKPPHVNYSENGFDVPERGVIAFGLGGIKHVGKAAFPIIEEREKNGPYRDFTDFCTRCPKEVGKAPLEALINAGALDGLGWSRMAMAQSIEQIVEFRKNYFKEKESLDTFEDSLFGSFGVADADDTTHSNGTSDEGAITLIPPFDTEYSKNEMLHVEKMLFDMYFSGDPADNYNLSHFMKHRELRKNLLERLKTHSFDEEHPRYTNLSEIESLPDNTYVELLGSVVDVRQFRTKKKGNMMAVIRLRGHGLVEESRYGFSPSTYSIKLTVFAKIWENMVPPQVDEMVYVAGRINKSEEYPTSIIVDELETLEVDSKLLNRITPSNQAEFIAAQQEMKEKHEKLGDPNSDLYRVAHLIFKTQDALDAFVYDKEIQSKYEDPEGRVVVMVDGDEGSTQVLHLRSTMGLVREAARYGATAEKRQLPAAVRAIKRRKLMLS